MSLDEDFLSIKRDANKLVSSMEKALENYKRNGFENEHVYKDIERLEGDVIGLVKSIEYMNKSTLEGRLYLRDDGRYGRTGSSDYYTCGSGMEAYIDEVGWCIGRVEGTYKDGKNVYYFLNSDDKNVDLYEGMRVRVRI